MGYIPLSLIHYPHIQLSSVVRCTFPVIEVSIKHKAYFIYDAKFSSLRWTSTMLSCPAIRLLGQRSSREHLACISLNRRRICWVSCLASGPKPPLFPGWIWISSLRTSLSAVTFREAFTEKHDSCVSCEKHWSIFFKSSFVICLLWWMLGCFSVGFFLWRKKYGAVCSSVRSCWERYFPLSINIHFHSRVRAKALSTLLAVIHCDWSRCWSDSRCCWTPA